MYAEMVAIPLLNFRMSAIVAKFGISLIFFQYDTSDVRLCYFVYSEVAMSPYPIPISTKDLLALLKSLAWPAVITKNKKKDSSKNFREDPRKKGRWLDGNWTGQPGKVKPNEAFGIHFAERHRLIWIGEYQGAQETERGSNVYRLILDHVEWYELQDWEDKTEAQIELKKILNQSGPIIYSYFFPPESPTNAGKCSRMAQIEVRLRQSAFRRGVFGLRGARCVITGCEVDALLDAAHLPGKLWFAGDNEPEDGIPLRVDLHRALDAGLIRLNEQHQLIFVNPELESEYGQYLHP